MHVLISIPLADIPWGAGIRVFVFGFSGVFVALGLLAAGVKVTSFVISRMEAASGPSDKQKG
jgi:Na+-transporting methylmalonyl-CoA/oxaloacetate decarboxylase gamma subunit